MGFCDGSIKAYTAVVYLRLEHDDGVCMRFVAAKTRVSPLGSVMIPRLEPLSALLLAKLITSVQRAIENQVNLDGLLCFTDSKVYLYWIKGYSQEWKQFIENRVKTIRSLVKGCHWFHCPVIDNPADIPSRSMTIEELSKNELRLNGSLWLADAPLDTLESYQPGDEAVPEECQRELECSSQNTHSLLVQADSGDVSKLIDCEGYSTLHRLLRVTKLVLRFVRLTKERVQRSRGFKRDGVEILFIFLFILKF